MTTYERVSYPAAGGGRRTVLLRDVVDTGRTIAGLEVDREGNLVEPSAAELAAADADTGVKRHVIVYAAGEDVRRTRLVEDWLTGRLVTDGKADQQTNPARYGK